MDITILISFILIGLSGFVLYIYKYKKQVPANEEEPKTEQKVPVQKNKKQKENIKKQNPKKQVPIALPTAEKVINLGNTTPLSLKFDPNNGCFYVTTQNRYIFIYKDIAIENGGNTAQRINFKEDKAFDCDVYSADGKSYIVLALDRTNKIVSYEISPESGKLKEGNILIEKASNLVVQKVAVSKYGKFVSVLGDETFLRVFHPNGNSLFCKDTSQMHNYEIGVSSNSELIAVSSFTSEVVVYGVERDKNDIPNKVVKTFTLAEHKNSIVTLDFSKKNLLVATGGKDCRYCVWLAPSRWREEDIPRLQYSGTIKERISFVRINTVDDTLAVIAEGNKLYFCRKEGIVKTVEVAHNHDISIAQWSTDGKWILVGSSTSQFIYAYANP